MTGHGLALTDEPGGSQCGVRMPLKQLSRRGETAQAIGHRLLRWVAGERDRAIAALGLNKQTVGNGWARLLAARLAGSLDGPRSGGCTRCPEQGGSANTWIP